MTKKVFLMALIALGLASAMGAAPKAPQSPLPCTGCAPDGSGN